MKTTITILISFLFIFTTPKIYSQYSEEEKNGLLYTLQEEKAAYDFYKSMFEKYNQKVFGNVMDAEKSHMQHVTDVINELNIDASVIDLTPGQFTNKDVNNIYEEMMKIGAFSFSDALRAAARYEENDILDLRKFYSKAENEKIKALYDCLDKATQNHMRAFAKNLKSEDIIYNPTVLTADEYNEIINSKNQSGDCFQTK
ncbi:MAG TPA: DUF2202 domain-containing protein [Ignavibacteria bacterium]|nr:DUF2202 domain-containing protein [Ignavibacteria bacterium]